MDVQMYTVGPVQENCYLVRREGSDRALLIDPGDEAPRLQTAMDDLGVEPEAILLTHTHFDHIGAVAAIARATGVPVYCPRGELDVLAAARQVLPADVRARRGLGRPSTRSTAASACSSRASTSTSSRRRATAPATSPTRSKAALFSGDVLFENSIGRTDLPGADHATLMASIAALLERFDDDTKVHPGHMGLTTLGRERATNPFLQALAER